MQTELRAQQQQELRALEHATEGLDDFIDDLLDEGMHDAAADWFGQGEGILVDDRNLGWYPDEALGVLPEKEASDAAEAASPVTKEEEEVWSDSDNDDDSDPGCCK